MSYLQDPPQKKAPEAFDVNATPQVSDDGLMWRISDEDIACGNSGIRDTEELGRRDW